MWQRYFTLIFILSCAMTGAAFGIIRVDDSGDPTVTPGDNSGWQYEGKFSNFLGTPIAPYYFLTAQHIGAYVNEPFSFHDEMFTVTEVHPDPNTDLQILKVDHAFSTYATLYDQAGGEPGQELHVFGRGTLRGTELDYEGTFRGWNWGASDGMERWGRNLVTSVIPDDDAGIWQLIRVAFDSPGLLYEAHLSVGDSGGGLFILENGIWRLAGINYGVDDLRTTPDPSTAFVAAVFDARGYYAQDDNGDYTLVDPNGPVNVPTNFYCTEIASRLDWIKGVIGGDPTVLAAEAYGDWQHAYFTPTQLADATVSGPNADADGDGIPNLLEFAFNLDPMYPEPAVMTAGTGLRGLPLIRPEQVAAGDTRLTVEFVRRTAGSGAGLTYSVQFTSRLRADAAMWQTGGTEAVTPINTRWERVKVTDTVSAGSGTLKRFARVVVTQAAQ